MSASICLYFSNTFSSSPFFGESRKFRGDVEILLTLFSPSRLGADKGRMKPIPLPSVFPGPADLHRGFRQCRKARQDREAIATTAGQDILNTAILIWKKGLRRQEWGATEQILRIQHSPCMPAEYHGKRQAAHHTRHLSGIALTDRCTNLHKSVSQLRTTNTTRPLACELDLGNLFL